MQEQCEATLFVRGAGTKRDKNASYCAGKRCPQPKEKGSRWCWQHGHTLSVGLATEEEILTGMRRHGRTG